MARLVTMLHPQLGCSIDELDTPALCIDLDAMQANIANIAALCRQHNVAWRPHAKGHKSVEIARRQLAAGAIGLTCAKLGEAEVFAAAGIRDLLIANQVVGPRKIQRLVALRRWSDPMMAIDNLAQAEPLSQAAAAAGLKVRVLIEVDLGMRRCGVLPGQWTLDLARAVAPLPGVTLAGLMGYEGHLLTVEEPAAKEDQIRQAMAELTATRDLLLTHGLPCPIVSAGGTGSYATTMACPGVTELQAGGLIFMDAFYRRRCQVAEFKFALTLLTTVVSRPAPERAVIDAGRKSHNAEVERPFVLGHESNIQVDQLSAEHGRLLLSPPAQHLRVGDRLRLVPGYGDFTSVLHDEFYVLQHDRLVDVWPLDARGKIR